MAVPFRLRQGEISIQVEFGNPTFSLFSNMLELGRALFVHLSPLGMRLADLKFTGGETTYADTHVTCFLYNIGAELNIRPERIEIRAFDPSRRDDCFAAVAAATAAAFELATDTTTKSCTSVSALHAELGDVHARDFISTFLATAPEGVGAQFSAGIVFYFEPSDGRVMSSVNLEPSAAIQDGLYFRTTNVWSTDVGDFKEIAKREREALERTIAAFGMETV